MLLHYYLLATVATSASAIEADGVTFTDPNSSFNYTLARGSQSYTGNNNNNAQVASAAIFCGTQESGGMNGAMTMVNNILDYSGAFFSINPSAGTCGTASAFPVQTNYNAGSGNACTSPGTCN